MVIHKPLTKKKGRPKNPLVTSGFSHKEVIDNLVEEFYKLKAEIRACSTSGSHKTKVFSGRKHELLWNIKKELDKVSKTKGDKIRKKLWEELGVVIG